MFDSKLNTGHWSKTITIINVPHSLVLEIVVIVWREGLTEKKYNSCNSTKIYEVKT